MKNLGRLATVLLVACLFGALSCTSEPAAEAPAPIDVGPGTHLFVDDRLVAETDRVWRSLNRPAKHRENPVVKPDRPWEGYLVLQPGTVIWDEEEQLFKMWYNTVGTHKRPYVEDYLCYATSRDGLAWEKPDLGLVEFRGSKKNNIFLKWSGWTHALLKDPSDPDPKRRYKLLYWQTHDMDRCGISVSFSPDGKEWTDYPENPVVPCWATGDTFSVTQEPDSGQYLLYHKTISRPIRKVSRLVSDDFIHWRDSQQVLDPDPYDPPDTEFYGLSAFPYAGQYLGILWVYHTYTQFMDSQLVSSRDGLEWERSVGRRRFMKLAPDGNYRNDTFDSGMAYPSSSPFVKDGKVWIYYSGFTNLHNAPSRDHDGQIGLGTLRQDGFVSFDATSEGWILTPPLKLGGHTLSVNMSSMTEMRPNFQRDSGKELYSKLYSKNPSAQGYVRVEVQDADGNALAGYEASNCTPVHHGDLYQKVTWEGGRDLSGVGDRPVRLKFVLGNTKLYSIKVE